MTFSLFRTANMRAKELYEIIQDETSVAAFLRHHQLLDPPREVAPCHKCGGIMVERGRKARNGESRLALRCTKKRCQTFRSFRQQHAFSPYLNLNDRMNSNLTVAEILELIYYFVHDHTLDTAAEMTGKSQTTIGDWFSMCRDVCSSIVSVQNRGQMIGTGRNPVQIDEPRFVGLINPNKTHLHQKPESTDSEADPETPKDLRLPDGPWVLGLKHGSDCRYFYVETKDEATLVPIILREVQTGSVLHYSESPAYANLHLHFTHDVSNQREQSDNRLDTGSWIDTKVHTLKKMQSVSPKTFQSHLDFICWKIMRSNSANLFIAFLSDVYRR